MHSAAPPRRFPHSLPLGLPSLDFPLPMLHLPPVGFSIFHLGYRRRFDLPVITWRLLVWAVVSSVVVRGVALGALIGCKWWSVAAVAIRVPAVHGGDFCRFRFVFRWSRGVRVCHKHYRPLQSRYASHLSSEVAGIG